MIQIVILASLLIAFSQQQAKYLPVVFLPGLGDSCENLLYVFIDDMRDEVSNKIFCIDPTAGFSLSTPAMERQVNSICEGLEKLVNEGWNLRDGFIFVGLSEGGLKARAALQVCRMGEYVKKLISIGGPQNGVGAVPHTGMDIFSDIINSVTNGLAYTTLVQATIEPTNYFHRIDDESLYFHSGIPLAKYNNVLNNNSSIIDRVSSLDALVLIMFSQDTMVEPKESAHFGFYKDHTKKEIVGMRDSQMYKEDWIGLKGLDRAGKIFFHEWTGEHLSFDIDDLRRDVFPHLYPNF